jgi:outer membrane usher protein
MRQHHAARVADEKQRTQLGDSTTNDGVPDVQSYHNLAWSKKGRFQLNISQSLGDLGSVYVSGSEQTYWGTLITG